MVGAVALAVLALAAIINRDLLALTFNALTLFNEDRIAANFRSMDRLFPTRAVRRSFYTHEFPHEPAPLPAEYTYGGQAKSVTAFLEDTWTTGLVVIRDDRIVFEDYYLGNAADSRTISWSLSKSFVSALIGIAIAEGRIANVAEPVTNYVEALSDTGFDGVPIRDVLQMSSGIRFDEDYGAFFSDINVVGRSVAFGGSLDEIVTRFPREHEPGTRNHYASINTQVLAMVLREATGTTVTEYLETRLWQPLGAKSDASWIVDGVGVEMAFGGMNAVLRDYARLGVLYLNQGRWNGRQILPAGWVRASVSPGGPHLQPGSNAASDSVMGYGYQWWIPEGPDGDFLAIGIHNQFIYVNPQYGVVIAKSSAYPDYVKDGKQKELESVAVFRAIARGLAAAP
ncbi:MAG: serine hydrolase domain-containing protein [Gammaproteobacteria bacterium]